MTAFQDEPDTFNRVDWDLLKNGPINLYWRDAYLDEHCRWLADNGYQLNEIDSSGWDTEQAMHREIALALGFPAHYGQNLDALNDCLSDLEVPGMGGRAIIFRKYDAFVRACPVAAQILLDILAEQSRRFLLFGLRLITLVQSDDPSVQFAPVGATSVNWNPREWLNSNRGL